MRPASISTVQYTPNQVPSDLPGLVRFLTDEFQSLSAVIRALSLGHLDKTYVAPEKPRDGDIRYADGVQWNPGAGPGIYWFNGTDWIPFS